MDQSKLSFWVNGVKIPEEVIDKKLKTSKLKPVFRLVNAYGQKGKSKIRIM